MEFIIISGMSGAGKSLAAGVLEDFGYYCVDNMPVVLLPKFAELCMSSRYDRAALVTDVRRNESFDELFGAIEEIRKMGCECEILFVECSPAVIIKRYKETRRRHPLDPAGTDIESAVYREKNMLSPVRNRAARIIDTTDYSPAMLHAELSRHYGAGGKSGDFTVNIVSFGFKHGLPADADLVFDVRFLPNPHYIPELKPLTGRNPSVSDFVLNEDISREFMDRTCDLIEFLIPQYIKESKRSLVVAFGCTGGKHRSVAVAEKASERISAAGYDTRCSHRDIDR
ncbi:MAG: RNase adapter RapZ [Clostridiales bacterium]|nr:RNase adapter RapZ [Clostridiales bacterium]